MDRIGIDLGGTKIEGILLDSNLNIIDKIRVPTNQNYGYESILESIVQIIKKLKAQANTNVTIGVCTPGIISQTSSLIVNSNTQCLIGKPLKKDLQNILGQEISIENDANCFAMAEARLGAGRNFHMVFGIIMGTGVGGGIIINGKLHIGRNQIAGEWGHHTLKINGNKCYCGKKGCLETYISGPSLEQRWYQLTGKQDSLQNIVKNLDSESGQIWKKEFLENFGIGISNVIDILDPDVIVLGGGVSNIPFLYTEGKNSVYSYVFHDQLNTPILKNQLGDSAGVYGASFL